jgi:HSP20 family protein
MTIACDKTHSKQQKGTHLMTLIQWDPWEELERLRAETNRMWDEFLGKLPHNEANPNPIAFLPDVDLVETANEYRLYVSVPGLIEEDIEIDIGLYDLTVCGEREPPFDSTHSTQRLGEWRYGYFERRIELPQPIQPDAVRASYDDGVLLIVMPKA